MENAIRTIRTLLPQNSTATLSDIEDAVNKVLLIYTDLDKTKLLREAQAVFNIRMDNFTIIESSERRRPWISEKKAGIHWGFWKRYKDYLQVEKNLAPEVLSKLDRLTDRTLDGLFDPSLNVIIDKRGLVVGQVQSGKTSNYIGLICKAADCGYKLIIVLAGIHNNLRSQTQLRVDEGFLGFDTQHQRAFNQNNLWIGVGRFDKKSVAHSLTSSLDKGDFSLGAANSLGINFNTNEPIIAVVKKNSKVLERLLQWLSAQSSELSDGRRVIQNKSLLLIDDEADNASINTRPEEEEEATRINSHIRNILRLFDKSGYVGYTATPFANIFIPIKDDDLFPRDFIINLPAPSNYIGPDRVFGFESAEENEPLNSVLPIIQRIDDFRQDLPNGHKRDSQLPSDLPESLKTAICCFIITCAIRRLRGQVNTHNSMLVHVTRFTNWQSRIKDLIENVFDFYRRGIEMNIPDVMNELREIFETDNNGYKSYKTISSQILESPLRDLDTQIQVHEWNDVLIHLNDAASRIQVKEIHGGSADALNYYDHKNGLSVIAVGGDKLSRGLTLEGLSVSYYLRASRMYDTLMQMGRWFGFRPGYVDLCRLFTSRELNEWFCHISLASEELRNEFDYMSDVAGSTPEQYALRVRTHPGVLQISASNKIRKATEIRVSWSGRLVESYELSKKPAIIAYNLSGSNEFIANLNKKEPEIRDNYYLWRNVEVENIIKFLKSFELYDNLRKASPANLLRFIEAKIKNQELNSWSVGLITKKKGTPFRISDSVTINLITRTQDEEKSVDDIYYIRKSHIISPDDEFIDLSDLEMDEALTATAQLWEKKNKTGEPKRPSGEWVRNSTRKPDKALMLLYYLDPVGAGLPDLSNPIVGYAFSFPGTDSDDAVSYAIHEQLLDRFNMDIEFEENFDDED